MSKSSFWFGVITWAFAALSCVFWTCYFVTQDHEAWNAATLSTLAFIGCELEMIRSHLAAMRRWQCP